MEGRWVGGVAAFLAVDSLWVLLLELSVLAEVKSVVEELVCNVRTESVGVAAVLFE